MLVLPQKLNLNNYGNNKRLKIKLFLKVQRIKHLFYVKLLYYHQHYKEHMTLLATQPT